MEQTFDIQDNKLVENRVETVTTVIEYNLDRLIQQREEQQFILDEIDEKIAEAEKQGVKTTSELALLNPEPALDIPGERKLSK